jgi:hypothetical protein
MINDNLDIKEKFVEMCKFCYEWNGEIFFPFETVIHSNEWVSFKIHPDYLILKEKMENLMILLNNDRSLVELDVIDDLWEMV